MSVQELENIQTNKMMYFCNQLGINDYSRAERYLIEANWDEKLAVQKFKDRHPNHIPNFQNNNPNFYPQNQPFFQPQFPLPSQINLRNRAQLPNNEIKENYLEFHIGDALYNDRNRNQLNLEINSLKKELKSIEINCDSFLKSLKNKPGIIIIFNKETYNIVKEHVKKINENNESRNIIQNSAIFPVSNNSLIGNELIQQFSIISFPCYIFCKYKDDRSLYLTDRMEGAFDINFFIKYLRKNQSQVKSNINLNEKTYLNLNNKKKNDNNKNSFINNLKKEHFNIGNIPQKGQRNNNNIKNNNPNAHNLNQNINSNQIMEDKKINENLNRFNPQNNININERYQSDNMGDFFLGDSIEMLNLFKDKNNNNNMNNKFLNPILNNMPLNQNENNNLADSIYQLSDAQVLQKRENDMKLLEEEQEKKEKKEIEENNRIQKLNKQYDKEAEFAKLILPKEPDESDPDICNIAFILPDGENRKERRFLKTETVSALYNYIKSIGREIFTEPDTFDFDILSSDFPPKNLEDKKSQTLEEEGMFPNSILKIREK